ncbi:MAG TPA: helix-turn-helix domain-containing protein [Rhizobiaceae bacterium]|nr:helix-turn-helix domain-containing protein [Rhizobiaceae bacterium]
MTRKPVKSAVRALEILKLFSEERRELNQKEIIGRLRYPQSSTTFLLKSMVSSGFLSFDRKTRTYLPAPEVYRLGEWLEGFGYEQMFRKGVLTALLDELIAETGETASITTQNDIYVQWHRITGDDPVACRRVAQGTALPLTWSSYGYMLLSRESDSQIDRVVRLINARETEPAYKLDVDATTAALRAARSENAFYMLNSRLSGVASIAALLPVRIAGRNVAVGIGGDSTRVGPRRDEFMRKLTDIISAYSSDLMSNFCEERHLAIAA